MEGRESWAEGGGGLYPSVPRAAKPLGREEPPHCPKPQKASEHTRGTSQFPKLMGHPQARAEGTPATVE